MKSNQIDRLYSGFNATRGLIRQTRIRLSLSLQGNLKFEAGEEVSKWADKARSWSKYKLNFGILTFWAEDASILVILSSHLCYYYYNNLWRENSMEFVSWATVPLWNKCNIILQCYISKDPFFPQKLVKIQIRLRTTLYWPYLVLVIFNTGCIKKHVPKGKVSLNRIFCKICISFKFHLKMCTN